MLNIHKHLSVCVLSFLALFFLTTSDAQASLYLKPRAGMAVPAVGGDPYYSVGATAGYQWIRLFGTELTYTRLLGYGSNGDGNSYRAQGVFSVPVGIVTPFATGGVGYLDFDGSAIDEQVITIFGGGISLSKILFLSASIGVDYIIVPGDQRDYVEPYISLGIAF